MFSVETTKDSRNRQLNGQRVHFFNLEFVELALIRRQQTFIQA